MWKSFPIGLYGLTVFRVWSFTAFHVEVHVLVGSGVVEDFVSLFFLSNKNKFQRVLADIWCSF